MDVAARAAGDAARLSRCYKYTSLAPRVYRHVTGGVAGGRCVCVAGYNDAGGFLDLQEQLGHRLGRVTKLLH